MANEQKKKLSARIFKGIVKSSKMDKTLVVEVQRSKKDPKYGKYFKKLRRLKLKKIEIPATLSVYPRASPAKRNGAGLRYAMLLQQYG